MGLFSLPLCPGLKKLGKDSTLNGVMTLQIHCHGGGGLEGNLPSTGPVCPAPFSAVCWPPCPHPWGSFWGLWPVRRSWTLRGVLERTGVGGQGQLFENAALSLL